MRVSGIVLCVLALTACGASRSSRAEEPRGQRSVRVQTSSAEPVGHPLAPLRPAGSEGVLAALSADPRDASAVARAALHFATTDASGMTLLWGAMYGAMGGGPEHGAVARAMRSVLETHVHIVRTATAADVSTSLAPGSVPVLIANGTATAPVAHLLELRATMGVIAWDGGAVSLGEATDVLVALAHGEGPGQLGLEAHVELFAWLATLDRAGLLRVFAIWLLGPAFLDDAGPAAAELGALQRHLVTSPLVPTHAVLPADLVPFP